MAINTEKLNATANGSNAGQGFTQKAKTDRPAAAQSDNPTDLNQVAQSEAMTIRESVNLSAGTGARALQALATQREQVGDTIAHEIARLTDPDLFFAETMGKAADLIRQRKSQRPDGHDFVLDFFDLTLELPITKALPAVNVAALPSLSSSERENAPC